MKRLRFVAAINPASPGFDALNPEASVPFVPLEAVWPGGLDLSRRRPKADVSTGYTRFQEGDILVPKITPTFQADRSAIARGIDGGVAAGTTELHVVRVRPGADERYVRYLFSSREFLIGGEAEMIGVAGQKRVPDEWLRDFKVPLTDTAMQSAVADYLDTETARIDALIAKKQRLTELLSERRQTVITSAVTGELAIPDSTPGRDPSAPAGGGEVTRDSWPIAQLRYVARFKYGDSLAVDSRSEGTVAVFGSNGPIGLHDRSNTLGPVIVVGRKGSFGKLQFSDLPVFAIDTTYFVDSTTTPHHHRWLYYALSTLGLDQLSEDVGVPGLSREAAYSQRLPVPAAVQQRAIADYLDTETARIDAIIRLTNKQIDLLREHRQALITAAVTGELEIPGVAA